MKNTKNYRFVDALFFFFAIFAILGYTELPLKANIVKPVLQLLFIFLTIKNVNFRDYMWLSPLLIVVVLWPLAAILLNIYSHDTTQILLYIAVFFFTLIFIICVSNFFKGRIANIINLWFYALNLSFMGTILK